MTDEQQKQFENFKTFARWMYDDCKTALDNGAQFLVAMALFNYIETLGILLVGYMESDGAKRTKTEDRFNAFFAYLGAEYGKLLKQHPELYDQLRCGLTHEALPKHRQFTIYKAARPLEAEVAAPILVPTVTGAATGSASVVFTQAILNTCGVKLLKQGSDERWEIFVPTLRQDFESAVKNLIEEIETSKNAQAERHFIEATSYLNFDVPLA